MFYCSDCDLTFDEPAQFTEYRGECHGSPAYETLYGCPICYGGFEEIQKEDLQE